jgi:hypothetical protein
MPTGLILVDIQNEYFPGGRMHLSGIEQAAGRMLATPSEWPTQRPGLEQSSRVSSQPSTSKPPPLPTSTRPSN